jgi:hypothetical protein
MVTPVAAVAAEIASTLTIWASDAEFKSGDVAVSLIELRQKKLESKAPPE